MMLLAKPKTTLIIFIAIASFAWALMSLPLNTLLLKKGGAFLISLPEPINVLGGKFHIQNNSNSPIWLIDYQYCSFNQWCINASNGNNSLTATLELGLKNININKLELSANSTSFKPLFNNALVDFATNLSIETIQISDFNCPLNDIKISNAKIVMSNLSVLGEDLRRTKSTDNTVNIVMHTENINNTSRAIVSGLLSGHVLMRNNYYETELKVADDLAFAAYAHPLLKTSGELPCMELGT